LDDDRNPRAIATRVLDPHERSIQPTAGCDCRYARKAEGPAKRSQLKGSPVPLGVACLPCRAQEDGFAETGPASLKRPPVRAEGSAMRVNLAVLVALLVVSGSSATAASLITGKQIKDGSVTGKDVRNRSLTPADFLGSVRGKPGPQGPAGRQGQ
jgi:hypothetical protein